MYFFNDYELPPAKAGEIRNDYKIGFRQKNVILAKANLVNLILPPPSYSWRQFISRKQIV